MGSSLAVPEVVEIEKVAELGERGASRGVVGIGVAEGVHHVVGPSA